MNEELVEHELKIHDKRINNHSERLEKLEQDNASLKVEIRNLCDNLKNLTKTMQWFMCLAGSTLLGFFIWSIQSKLF